MAHELLRRVARLLPVHVNIAGRARSLALKVGDPLTRARRGHASQATETVDYGGVPLVLDLAHDNERLLSYCLWNVVRHFRASPLGRFIRTRAHAPGAVFVDVGANLGIYALLAREAGYASWVVECEPRHSAFLARNERHFDEVFTVAASDREGVAQFFVAPTGNAGASSLVGVGTTYDGAVSVPTARLDQILPARLGPGQHLSLLKIDVEGAEEAVVAGLSGLLADRTGSERPAIWCEVRGPRSGRCANTQVPVRRLLAEHGYDAWRSNGVKHTRFAPASEADLPRVFDLLFLPRS